MVTDSQTSSRATVHEGHASTAPASRTHFSRVRSFVVRAGRTTTGQQHAIAQFGPRYVLPFRSAALDSDAAFGRSAPLILEIGFGMGDATAEIAKARRQDNFLCCEVHTPGVGALLKRIGEEGIENIRIIQHDAVEVIEHMLQPGMLAGVHIFFPDPWHKKRHHKRRLIQAPFVQALVERLAPGGYVHCATDWQEYAEQMVAQFSAHPLLRNQGTLDGGYASRPWYRPETKFERRGLRLGHGVWDVVFVRQEGGAPPDGP
ncbi:tRNA (guanine-N7)-methyltransferase [Lampropedia cohaerens]|uniref:tRNA (guanine-N(7)-)-methyltransferase n=1 Tax=Lampropedia cohaerens TaxID=1610491 RepID=A0A0U1Q1I1_9BURK|nr:tRNA (guanosine(46)-N7)-methyltransferase TrmB [Lampropedia cohaerens]KKW68618.1 tRNA (guanine-N7)-methyltransferase [Lampropedia cohaerens]